MTPTNPIRGAMYRLFSEDSIFTGPTGIIFGKSAEFVGDVDSVLLRLQQGGIVDRQFSKTMSSR